MAFQESCPAATVAGGHLADAIATYVRYQIDSRRPVRATVRPWAGQLSPSITDVFRRPPTRTGALDQRERPPTPTPPDILYLCSAGVLSALANTGVVFHLVDLWDRDMADGLARLPEQSRVQGNVDPGAVVWHPRRSGPGWSTRLL